MAISRTEANRIVEAAVANARELGIRICVAVCDAGGRLLAFSRMDGANWAAGAAREKPSLQPPSGGPAGFWRSGPIPRSWDT